MVTPMMLSTIAAAAGEVHVELPMNPIWFGVIAMIAFLLLLVVTISFSNSWHRAGRPLAADSAHTDHSDEHQDPVGDDARTAVEH